IGPPPLLPTERPRGIAGADLDAGAGPAPGNRRGGLMNRGAKLGWALMLATVLVLAAGAVASSAQEGTRLVGVRGEELTQSDLERGSTVLVVWASWSPRCRDIVERVNPLAERWGGKARVATVNFQEDRSAVDTFLR